MNDTNEKCAKKINMYAQTTVGPVVYEYTGWIINECLKRGIDRIYFLARDGYLLYETAKRICAARNLRLDCRYLYCSRQSLRTPTYHFIGEEAFDLLLLNGYYMTPRTLLERAKLGENEMADIFEQLNVAEPDRPFAGSEFKSFCEKIRGNATFKEGVFAQSKASYDLTIEYFRQEGLFDSERIAIADSGWTGSMQRSLRQLLEFAGHRPQMFGFYFGMYAEPKEEDGTYLTYYFSAKSGLRRKLTFNNNLFECMLSANHSMTMGYAKCDHGIAPVFAKRQDDGQLALIEAQIDGALKYVDDALTEDSIYDQKRSLKKCSKILKSCMTRPSKEFAATYGNFFFCDDVTEAYSLSIADPRFKSSLKNYMLLPRVLRKLFNKESSDATELFWPYGVIAFCAPLLRPWYRLNVWAWDLLKAILLN